MIWLHGNGIIKVTILHLQLEYLVSCRHATLAKHLGDMGNMVLLYFLSTLKFPTCTNQQTLYFLHNAFSFALTFLCTSLQFSSVYSCVVNRNWLQKL